VRVLRRGRAKAAHPPLSTCRQLKAVDNLTLAVPSGECFALLGPNGAGKTTALSVLTGVVAPTSGEASLHGLSTSSSLMEVFQLTGFCPQLKGLWENLTLRQHLHIMLRLKGFSGAALQAEVAKVETGYGLEEHAHKRAKRLSGGTQRKLSAAMALSCGRPKVVFVDEPTTGVDVGTRRFIWDRIKEASRDSVVMLTTHYMDEADALAQRIGIMAAGKLRVLGSPQHLKSRHGGGYRVELKGPAESTQALTKLVTDHFSEVTRVASHQGTLAFDVAHDFALAKVFADFEAAKGTLGLETFTMSQTTLEDVFLRVAEANKSDSKREGLKPPGLEQTISRAQVGPVDPLEMERGGGGSKAAHLEEGKYINACCNVVLDVKDAQPEAEPPSYVGQCWCFALQWVVPIPCCCCPEERMTLLPPDDASRKPSEEGKEIYVNKSGSERHVWDAPGKFKQTSKFGDDSWRKIAK